MLGRIGDLMRLICPVALLMLAVAVARADVFNMPAGQTSLQTVPVGDPGNAPDTTVMLEGRGTGYGSVGYVYDMGTYEVTNAQYCQFLNAQLPTITDAPGFSMPSDTYGLYNWNMTLDPQGGINYDPGAAIGAKFSTKPGSANWPVVEVSPFDALRFCNWLQNGQGNGDTESGTYTIANGGPDTGIIAANPRSDWTLTTGHWALPTENEWYKAAYYKGGGTNSGYWTYATSTNATPTWLKPADVNNPAYQAEYGVSPANAANYLGSGGAGYPRANGSLIDVGSYPLSVSPYGTLDQDGNAYEWTDASLSPYPNLLNDTGEARGGDYTKDAGFLASDMSRGHPSDEATDFFGFRVDYVPGTSDVPEPGCLAMLAAIAAAGLLYKRRAAASAL
jgi:formylglycine-generating enzyme required for sulfatase activity